MLTTVIARCRYHDWLLRRKISCPLCQQGWPWRRSLNYRPVSEAGNDKVASDLSKAFYDAGDKKYDAFVFTERQDKLLAREPARGTIVSTDSLRQFDTKVYVLSNGIKVLARRSDSKPGQLYVRGFSRGGLSRHYAPADVPTLLCVNELMAEMPCGGLVAGRYSCHTRR